MSNGSTVIDRLVGIRRVVLDPCCSRLALECPLGGRTLRRVNDDPMFAPVEETRPVSLLSSSPHVGAEDRGIRLCICRVAHIFTSTSTRVSLTFSEYRVDVCVVRYAWLCPALL